MALGTVQESWHLRASCRGPLAELFFPPSAPERREQRAEREARAKRVCASCPVQSDCRDLALRLREPHGIWGGLTEAERRQILGN